jgi:O-antigen ligase
MSAVVAVALVPLLVAFLVACFRSPMGVALPAYALVLPFGQGITTGLPGAFGSVSSLLGIVLGLALLVQAVTTRRAVTRMPAPVPVWLAFLALTGASVFWSLAPQTTVKSFSVLASLVLLFTLIALARVERTEFVRIEDALLLGGVASASYGLLQLLVLGGLPSSDAGSPRFGNDLLGPNNQAAALLLPLAIAIGRILLRSRGGVLLNLGAVTVMLVGVLMTGSRGGLLAVAVAIVVLTVATPRGRVVMLSLGVASLALITVVLLVNPAGIGERQVNQRDASSGREEIWSVGLHACRTYCLTGSGWGTFPDVYAEQRAFVPEARVLRNGTSYEPHNIWMLAGIEAGLLGLVLVAYALSLTVLSAVRLPATLRAPPLAALVATVFAGFFLSNLEYKFFWMVLIYVVLCQNYAATSAPGARQESPAPVGV